MVLVSCVQHLRIPSAVSLFSIIQILKGKIQESLVISDFWIYTLWFQKGFSHQITKFNFEADDDQLKHRPEDDETNKEDGLNLKSPVAKEAGIDQNYLRKHVDKIHPTGGAKKTKTRREL